MKLYTRITVQGKILHNDAELLRQELSKHANKDVCISIERKRKKRSLNQNDYFHGPFLDEVWEMYLDKGNDFDRKLCKELIKEMFGPRKEVTQPDGRAESVAISTADWTSQQAEETMEKARAWAAQYGYQISYPNEHIYKPIGEKIGIRN